MSIDLPPATRARLLRTRRWVLAGTAPRYRRTVIGSVSVYYLAQRGYRWIGRQPVVGPVARAGLGGARRLVRAVRGPR